MNKPVSRLLVVFFCSVISVGLFAEDTWQNVGRVVAVGDVHGDYDNFLLVLKQAGIVNRRGNWQAGDTHLVQMGDVPDRGPDTGKIIELLKKLERQARRRGGMVHMLIGNHEAMNMLGDLRYVHPGEFQAFVNRSSERLRDRYYELVVRSRQEADPEFEATPEFRAQWEERVPLGYVEHRLAWSPEGEYGSWVLEHNAIIKIDRLLFVHGGISPAVLGLSLEEINSGVREELSLGEAGQAESDQTASNRAEVQQTGAEQTGAGQTDTEQAEVSQAEVFSLTTSDDGPLWYRGLAMSEEALESPNVDAALAHFDVDRIVVGHTPGLGTIVPRFDGKVLVIDSGISTYYGGHLSSLTVEDGQLFNTQEGERLEIPVDGADPVPYFEAVVGLEPGLETLQRYLIRLQPEAPGGNQEAPDGNPEVPGGNRETPDGNKADPDANL